MSAETSTNTNNDEWLNELEPEILRASQQEIQNRIRLLDNDIKVKLLTYCIELFLTKYLLGYEK
jgi:hypothetical protein